MLYPLALSNMIGNAYFLLTSHVTLHWLKTRLYDELLFVDVNCRSMNLLMPWKLPSGRGHASASTYWVKRGGGTQGRRCSKPTAIRDWSPNSIDRIYL